VLLTQAKEKQPAETLSVHWHYYAPLSTLLLSPKEKRVILIGDAAHLTPPVGTVEVNSSKIALSLFLSLMQIIQNDGAAAAIEDAVLLTRKLKNFASQAHLSELEASSLRGQFHTETVARNLGRSWRLRRREKQMVSSGFLALMKQTGRRLLFRFGGSYHQ
jgi:2-polyprenyl-6-methoxyphenol hydroxylase-like FAD-dependent oxidoreductase